MRAALRTEAARRPEHSRCLKRSKRQKAACHQSRRKKVRLFRACSVVACMLGLVPLTGWVEGQFEGETPPEALPDPIQSAAVVSADDPLRALDDLEARLEPGDEALPPGFAEEVGLPVDSFDVRVGAKGAVVGYSVTGEASAALEQLTEHCASCGWSSVPLGGVTGATFVKEEGACRWMLATCSQVQGKTTVVLRMGQ